MVSDVLRNKWVQAVGLLGAIIVVSVVLYLLSAVLVPLFFAFIVAYVFDPVIDKIETYKISRVGAIVTLVGGIVLAAILLPLFVLPGVIEQAGEMKKKTPSPTVSTAAGESTKTGALTQPPAVVPGGVEQASEIRDPTQAAVVPEDAQESTETAALTKPGLSEELEDWLQLDRLVRAMKWGLDENGHLPENPDSIAIIRRELGDQISANVEGVIRSLLPQFPAAGSSVVKMLSLVGDAFLRLFLFVGNFVLFAFVAIYLLKDYDHIVASVDALIPHHYRPKVREIMGRVDRQLRSFLRGQFTVCCCLGTMYAIGFLISGTPFALLLALFGALASFVPYLGLILTIGPAVILTILYHGGIDWPVLGVLITFAVAQFLEGNFLTPKIVGSQVGLGPVWVILAIMVFSSTLGFIGLLLAVPIAAVLKVLAEEALALYRESAFFGSEVPAPSAAASKGSSARKATPSPAKGRRRKKV